MYRISKSIAALSLFLFLPRLMLSPQINLSKAFSMDEFRRGVRSFHDAEYEQSIVFFHKALKRDPENFLASYFLGDSYRKAGYEKNALFTWNNLMALGYNDRSLRTKVGYLYNKRGLLSEISINKNFLLKEDIKGILNEESVPLFIKPSQIAVDLSNHYYIASFLTGLVVELDPNLTVVKNHFAVAEKIKKPFGVAVDGEGLIYISDFAGDTVVSIDRYGIIKQKIGYKGIGDGALLGPQYLMFDDQYDLYVVDSGNARINKYKKNGDFILSFGRSPDKESGLGRPAGMLYLDGRIFVCDRDKNRVSVFDKSGNYMYSFGAGVLERPYSITYDRYGRLLILCEKTVWAYEPDNEVWYVIDAVGKRLERGISIITDKNDNILITDFNESRLLVLSHERERYTNLNVNIERAFVKNFPEVHLAVTVEKDDLTVPVGINSKNIYVYENGRSVNITGTSFTPEKDSFSDIAVIFDNNHNMQRYKDDLKLIMDNWMKNKKADTSVSFVVLNEKDSVVANELGAARLSILDTIDRTGSVKITDKGAGIKTGIYNMIRRFSKKAIILITDSGETGNDFEMFKMENCVSLACNNNIPLYIVTFEDGPLGQTYEYMAKKTGGDLYRVYRRNDLNRLFERIETAKGKELIISYRSEAPSRFGDDPISLTLEIDFAGMNGVAKSVYYPPLSK